MSTVVDVNVHGAGACRIGNGLGAEERYMATRRLELEEKQKS